MADQLPENAYTTVATVLDRLVHKELVRRRMDGRKIHFTPVGSPGAHAAVLMRQAMAVGSDPDAALATFARTLSPSELATLREALDGVGLEAADSAVVASGGTRAQIIRISMNAMPMHITTWLRSSSQGMATSASSIPGRSAPGHRAGSPAHRTRRHRSWHRRECGSRGETHPCSARPA